MFIVASLYAAHRQAMGTWNQALENSSLRASHHLNRDLREAVQHAQRMERKRLKRMERDRLKRMERRRSS